VWFSTCLVEVSDNFPERVIAGTDKYPSDDTTKVQKLTKILHFSLNFKFLCKQTPEDNELDRNMYCLKK
jgi:hypothetical protein